MTSSTSNSKYKSRTKKSLLPTAEDSSAPRPSRFRSFRRLGWGLLIALLLLGVADGYVFRNAYMYDMGVGARGGFIGQWAHLDRSFKATDPGLIEYAVFGDSQSLDAFRPDIMADELGVSAESIFNFSVSGGKPTDIAYTYSKYIDQLPNLTHILLVVNEHQFNNVDAGQDSKFKFHASFGQRWQAVNKDNYGELMSGWVLRSFGMRAEWQKHVARYGSGELPASPPAFPGGIQPYTWSKPEDRTAEFALTVADRWFKGWQLDGVYTAAFDEFVGQIRSDGIRLTIVQIPRTDLFEREIQAQYAVQQQAYLAHIRGVASAHNVEFVVMDGPAADGDDALGLTLESFRDTNHVNPQGAELLSRYVADRWWR